MAKKQSDAVKKKPSVTGRLFWANVIAFLAFLIVLLLTLRALGLLDSMVTFFFK